MWQVLCGLHGLGEDVCGCGLGAADYVGVHAQGYSWVGVAQAGGDDLKGHAREQQGRGPDTDQALDRLVNHAARRTTELQPPEP
jgi:hypothetical protein